MPRGPSGSFLEIFVDRVADGGPFRVAELVDKVQISSDHGLQITSDNRFLDKTASTEQRFGCSRHTNASLMHGEELGAQLHSVLMNAMLRIARAEKLVNLYRP